MQSLTGGRFVLGLGRGIPVLQDAYGIAHITTAELEDFAGIMRRLFRGEVIFGHDGPAGKYPLLHLDSTLDEHLPMSIVAFGPNTLALGGRVLRRGDSAHLLHRRDDRALRAHRQGRGRGRPDATRPRCAVWSCFATVGDHLPGRRAVDEDSRAPRHVPPGLRRAPRAHQRLGSGDPRAIPGRRRGALQRAGLDTIGTTEQLEHVAALLPDEWLAPSATGSPAQCAAAVRNQFAAGLRRRDHARLQPERTAPGRRGIRAAEAPGCWTDGGNDGRLAR